MSMKQTTVAVTRRFPDKIEARLADLFDTRLCASDRPLSDEEFKIHTKGADVIAATLGDNLDAAFFENADPRLKLVANFGAGIDHIDVEAANKPWHYGNPYALCYDRRRS